MSHNIFAQSFTLLLSYLKKIIFEGASEWGVIHFTFKKYFKFKLLNHFRIGVS